MYYIVEFAGVNDGTPETAIVPACWMSDDQEYCFWPPYRDTTQAVKKSEMPDKLSWTMWKARTLKAFSKSIIIHIKIY